MKGQKWQVIRETTLFGEAVVIPDAPSLIPEALPALRQARISFLPLDFSLSCWKQPRRPKATNTSAKSILYYSVELPTRPLTPQSACCGVARVTTLSHPQSHGPTAVALWHAANNSILHSICELTLKWMAEAAAQPKWSSRSRGKVALLPVAATAHSLRDMLQGSILQWDVAAAKGSRAAQIFSEVCRENLFAFKNWTVTAFGKTAWNFQSRNSISVCMLYGMGYFLGTCAQWFQQTLVLT